MTSTPTHNTMRLKVQLLTFLLIATGMANAQLFVQAESGLLFIARNDIRNGREGTQISLKDDLSTSIAPYLRVRLGYLFNDRHHFSLLYAPLRLTASGVVDEPVSYDGAIYAAGLPIEARYEFNSYRLTYNRRLFQSELWDVGIGLSAKIRDAGSSFRNSEVFKEDFSIGFVPLINLISNWHFSDKGSMHLFADGLTASRGRAIDVSISGSYVLSPHLDGAIGYRLLDGGSDGVSNYNFVRLHFATIGLTYDLH